MLDERPVWTRRALSNRIAVPEWNNIGKFVYQYVGYTFRSGPWREALIKFGVDPRTDPRYRIYQTMTFRLDRMEPVVKASVTRNRQSRRGGARVRNKDFDRQSHIFDGVNLNPDGKVWQVCDVTDPLLASILSTSNLRDKCDVRRSPVLRWVT